MLQQALSRISVGATLTVPVAFDKFFLRGSMAGGDRLSPPRALPCDRQGRRMRRLSLQKKLRDPYLHPPAFWL